jgi:hypothetical protein
MRIFISYSRSDESIAHLLSYILNGKGIKCLIDRELRAGGRFDESLQNIIRQADLVLVLLTNAAISSPWVNQEIGFAIANEKPIWPLAIERDIEPRGMLSTTQSYSLFDWSDPHTAIDRLVGALLSVAPAKDNYLTEFGFDLVLQGRVARTRFLARRLQELAGETDRRLLVLNQAAFSIFAASDDPMYREAGKHSEEYMSLLLAERKALNNLVLQPHCSFRLILWPVRAYEPKYLAVRYETLLRWMSKVKEHPNIEYVCTPYPGPNRLIVADEFSIEGYKLHHHPGYDMNFKGRGRC